MKNLISLREIADDKTSISSTRWAFASVVKVDLFIVLATVISGLVGHFIDKPLDPGIYANIAMLLGVLTGIITTSKALQGFETKKDDKKKTTEEEGK